MGCVNSTEITQAPISKESTKQRHKNKNVNLRKKSIQQTKIACEQFELLKTKLSKEQVQFAISKLSSHQLFNTLQATDLESISKEMVLAVSSANKYVFKQGDPGVCFFIIYKGSVDVFIDEKYVRTLEKGHCFGQLALLLRCSRTASVICKQDQCQFLIMQPEQYKAVIQKMKKQEYSRNLKTIEKVPLFGCLTNKQKFSLSNYVKEMTFNAGETIFNAGDDALLIYIISKGEVKIEIKGKNDVTIHAGQIFGQASVQESMKRSGRAVAVQSVCCSVLSRHDIESVLGSSIHNLIFYNTKKWALLRSPVFNKYENDINDVITSFESIQIKNMTVLDSKIYNGFLICLEGKINNKDQGIVFNESGWIDQTFKTEKLIKNGDGQCGYLSYAKARELFKQIEHKKFTVEASKKYIQIKKPGNDIKLQDFTNIKRLGEGQFGQVYLVKNNKYGANLYALKCLNRDELIKQDMIDSVAYQRTILQKTIFPFIVGFVKAFQTQKHIFLLMEYIHGRQMFDVIRQVQAMSSSMVRYFIACLVISVQYLHSQSIIYRDIKPENSVVDHKGKVYLIDLGTAKLLKSQECFKTFTIIGTPHYMAPQVFEGNGYSFEADIWSIGCVLYEFLCFRVPFGEGYNDPYQIYSVIKKQSLSFPSSIKDQDVRQLMQHLLAKNPKTRSLFTFDKIKACRYYAGFDWVKLIKEEIQPPYVPKRVKEARMQSLMKLQGKNFLKYFYKDEGVLPVREWDQTY